MRIAYLVNQYPKVSHTFIRREIDALEARGLAVARFALRGWDAQVADAADRGEQARTHYLLRDGVVALGRAVGWQALRNPRGLWQALRAARGFVRGSDRGWLKHAASLAEACLLQRQLQQAGIRHLHAHFGTNSAEVAALTAALGGVTFSFTVHGPEEFDRAGALHLGAKAAQAAFVVAISQFGRSQLYRWCRVDDWPKLQVVHCGLEEAFFAASSEELTPPRGQQLVCVGRLCEQKGPLILVAAAAELKARGVPFELVFAGDGELRAAVEAAIERAGLQAQVHITGWIDAAGVRALLLASRALVLPSFAEGLPVVLMEALAVGRPVISTYVAGIPELVRPQQEGWLTPAGDVAALADAMAECLSADEPQLRAMGARGWQRVRERHAIDPIAGQLDALLRPLAGPLGTVAAAPASD